MGARARAAQLYNEEVNDLLAAEGGKLQIHESREAGVHVAGLREEIVTSAEHVLALLEQGEAARHVGETRMNKASSRSHTIFRMARGLPHPPRGLEHAASCPEQGRRAALTLAPAGAWRRHADAARSETGLTLG